jgi:dynein heavy chain
MQALVQAEKDLAKTENILARAMAKLQAVQNGLNMLKFKFSNEEKKKADLEKQKQLCEERMARAVRLITGLAGEQVRWFETVADIKRGLTNIVGDILLSAGQFYLAKTIRLCAVQLCY